MSNRLSIVRTEFKDIKSKVVTYGYRLYDDYDCTYSNYHDKVPQCDMELLQLAVEGNAKYFELFEENQSGVYIDDVWYGWDEIKHVVLGEET